MSRGPERLARVADGPALGQGPADEAGGVGPGRLAHGRHGGVEGAAEQDDARVVGVGCTVRRQWLERRLHGAVARTEQRREHRVDGGDDAGDGAEVAGEAERLRGDEAPHLQEQLDVGAAEAVDGLLRVADEEEAARVDHEPGPVGRGATGRVGEDRVVGRDAGDAHGELGLDGIGVLELVEEQVRPATPQLGDDHRVRAEQVAGEHEQVVEVERARRPPGRGRLEGEVAQLDDQVGERLAPGREREPPALVLCGRAAGRGCRRSRRPSGPCCLGGWRAWARRAAG